jgi:hypothetical protein
MSWTNVFTPLIGLMGTKSTPMIIDVIGIVLAATYGQKKNCTRPSSYGRKAIN